MSRIKSIKAREILDSKGNPTVEVALATDLGVFEAAVPSGVSTGKLEAVEIRDGGERYLGKGVLKAVAHVNEIIAPALLNKDPGQQKEIDELMIGLDGTENKARLGANAILPVSLAVCRAGASAQNLPLYSYLALLAGNKADLFLPDPCFLMIEGGLHAGNQLSVQEFMLVLKAESYQEQLRKGTEIYHHLKEILKQNYGPAAINVGLEGGFAASGLEKSETALGLIMEAVAAAGSKAEAKIILDVAASSFFKNQKYFFEKREFTYQELAEFFLGLAETYPLLGIEDPFEEEDWPAWQELKLKIKNKGIKTLLIGDDLTVTNKKRIERAVKSDCLDGVIIKLNQIGTVFEAIESVQASSRAGLEVFIKHRSGETNDDFIADLAVGLGAKYIMPGAPSRGERIAKYNRLLKIETVLF